MAEKRSGVAVEDAILIALAVSVILYAANKATHGAIVRTIRMQLFGSPVAEAEQVLYDESEVES